MNEEKIKSVAKKIQHANTYLELHDIIIRYAKLYLNIKKPFSPAPFSPTGGKQDHEYDNPFKTLFNDDKDDSIWDDDHLLPF